MGPEQTPNSQGEGEEINSGERFDKAKRDIGRRNARFSNLEMLYGDVGSRALFSKD
jgi:hypothetical protein